MEDRAVAGLPAQRARGMRAGRTGPRALAGFARRLGLLLALLVAGCASFSVVDTAPLPRSDLAPPDSDTISVGGYRLSTLASKGDDPDMLIIVALSGGGKRSAAFGYGALKGMREVMVPTAKGDRPLLDELDVITGVSGGSFTAAYYGLHRAATFGHYEDDFLYADTESYIYGIYLLPWNWSWIVDPTVGTNDYMEQVYDRTMFHGAEFKDLRVLGRPMIGIGATDISYGTPFAFTQEFFDVLCADLDQFPVARAVAASNGFPGLFSPVTLTNRAASCGGREPGWVRRVTPAQRLNPLSRVGVQANMIGRYLDPDRTRYVHLADGGISDNLGLRIAGGMMENLALSPAAITRNGYERLRRILLISVDGQGAQDPTVAQRKVVGGLFSLLGLVSGGQIDRYNFETLYTVSEQIQQIVRSIKAARCARAPTIDGASCDDVQGALVHISLVGMPDSPEKKELLAIPTGLTLKRQDVDLLVAAGAQAVTGSRPLRTFLDNYPPRPVKNSRQSVERTASGS